MPRVILSLPPAMAPEFGGVFQRFPPCWFAVADPPGSKLGSGGGVLWALREAFEREGGGDFSAWLDREPTLVVLAGGVSRRLPAYSVRGKLLAPMPVLRGRRGQALEDTFLDFMLPGIERLAAGVGAEHPVAVASGDVVLETGRPPREIPRADVLVCAAPIAPEQARCFGVVFTAGGGSPVIEFMRQKPGPDDLRRLVAGRRFFVDTGLWFLNRKALAFLFKMGGWSADGPGASPPRAFELYADFGQALGRHPSIAGKNGAGLDAAVIELAQGGFIHFGSNAELFHALETLEARGISPGEAPHGKPNADIYVLNSDFPFSTRNVSHHQLWIENCSLPAATPLGRRQILTGIPAGFPLPALEDGQCLDVVPVDGGGLCLRFYGFEDVFHGAAGERSTLWLGAPLEDWFLRRGLSLEEAGIARDADIVRAALFPVLAPGEIRAGFVAWLFSARGGEEPDFKRLFLRRRESFLRLGEIADVRALECQRAGLLEKVLPVLQKGAGRNPFLRLDLAAVARRWPAGGEVPTATTGLPPLDKAREAMFFAEVERRRGGDGSAHEQQAFETLAGMVISGTRNLWREPRRAVLDDQIVWGRSPVRLDLAGGWSDTPPYCHTFGGAVVNVAADINGQPPVQVFLRAARGECIRIRSIDLGSSVAVREIAELEDFGGGGDGFALAKAALCLAGFHPKFRPAGGPATLREILEEFGAGLEISLLAAVPKGSGLGTSSILAATLLAVLSKACDLGWDAADVMALTLAAEQMLGSGGGWQDQAGGLYPGVKLLETGPGLSQRIVPRWAPPAALEGEPGSALLYYTGITRKASGILREIVRGLFLNSAPHLRRVGEIHDNARVVYDALLRGDREELARGIHRSWQLNCALDSGTAPPAIAAIMERVADWVAGAKVLGAGGGGYALFLAKDSMAGRRIRAELEARPPNATARFVDFAVSGAGMRVTSS